MREKGIIKVLAGLVIGLSVLFLVIALTANYISPLTTPQTNTSSGNGDYGTDYTAKSNPLIDFGGSDSYGREIKPNSPGSSKYAGQVFLSTGSASYAYQPYEEYVTITNEGGPVNITGWKLENGKGTRPIEYSQNSYVYPSPESAFIGTGTEFLDPSGKYSTGPIILAKGDEAIVTTSGPFSNFPLPITTNFRENMCVGYLDNYPFYPSLDRQCPLPADDPEIRTVTDECFDYMESLYRCQNPQKTDLDRYNEQTSQCRAFISRRLNYASCVANNRYSPDFASKQWRIFLGRSHELWSSNREVISLYDATGLLVDQISY